MFIRTLRATPALQSAGRLFLWTRPTTWALRSARVIAEVLVSASFVLTASCTAPLVAQSQESCACVELDRAMEGLSVMSRIDWEPLERSRLAEMWPTAIDSCEPLPTGLFVEEEFYDLCCSTCGTCGGQRLVESDDSSIVTLHAMGVLVCRDTQDEAKRDQNRLVEAAIPQNANRSYESVRENGLLMDTYRWDSRGETFLLKASILERRQAWIGRTEVIRCQKWDSLETWSLDDGSEVDILGIAIDPKSEDVRWIRLDYATRCVLATESSCIQSEVHRVWSRLMTETDLSDVDVVSIAAQGCGSEHQTILTKDNGEWTVSR